MLSCGKSIISLLSALSQQLILATSSVCLGRIYHDEDCREGRGRQTNALGTAQARSPQTPGASSTGADHAAEALVANCVAEAPSGEPPPPGMLQLLLLYMPQPRSPQPRRQGPSPVVKTPDTD
jgi:hypothetical protein